jgi:GNAT superfamily N-acetyltransferase
LSNDIELTRDPISSGREMWIASAPGEESRPLDARQSVVARVVPRLKTARIVTSSLDKDAQGQGIGLAMYQRLIDEAHQLGYAVGSDTSVSPKAQRIYDALSKRGYDVQKHPDARTSYWLGNLMTNDGRSVFTVGPPPPLRRGGIAR